jgi:hypothetical protein
MSTEEEAAFYLGNVFGNLRVAKPSVAIHGNLGSTEAYTIGSCKRVARKRRDKRVTTGTEGEIGFAQSPFQGLERWSTVTKTEHGQTVI